MKHNKETQVYFLFLNRIINIKETDPINRKTQRAITILFSLPFFIEHSLDNAIFFQAAKSFVFFPWGVQAVGTERLFLISCHTPNGACLTAYPPSRRASLSIRRARVLCCSSFCSAILMTFSSASVASFKSTGSLSCFASSIIFTTSCVIWSSAATGLGCLNLN